MTNEETTTNQPGGTNTEAPQYDPGIVPQEVAARKQREGGSFGGTSEETEAGSINTTSGNTVDQEGLANVYPIETEMYVETPGDLRQEEEAATRGRAEEVGDVQRDTEEAEGSLSSEGDTRGRGPGGII